MPITPQNSSENRSMKDSENVTIRFNFKSHPKAIVPNKQIPNEKVGYDYHWGRIIGCSLIVILIGGAVIAGNAYFNQDEAINLETKPILADTDNSKKSVEPTTDATITTDLDKNETLTEQSPAQPLINSDKPLPVATNVAVAKAKEAIKTTKVTTADSLPTTNSTNSKATEILQTSEVVKKEIKVADDSSIKSAPVKALSSEVEALTNSKTPTVIANKIVKSESSPATNKQIKSVTPKTEKTAVKAVSTKEISNTVIAKVPEKAPTALFTQSKVEILSSNIQRFVFSNRVINNEPDGGIDEIVFDNKIAAVYAFSDVSDLENTPIYYLWSLDGEEISKVKVDVGGDSWRSYSSKIIQPAMRGAWKVELQDENGKTLGINRFNY